MFLHTYNLVFVCVCAKQRNPPVTVQLTYMLETSTSLPWDQIQTLHYDVVEKEQKLCFLAASLSAGGNASEYCRSLGGLHECFKPKWFLVSGVINYTMFSKVICVFLWEQISTVNIHVFPWRIVLYVICMLFSFEKRNHTMVLCFNVKCCVGCYNNRINIQICSV